MSARDELLAQMVSSEDVRLRGRGVIGTWLLANTEIPDVIEAADELIKATLDAGLVTMIKTDLDRHIEAIRAQARLHQTDELGNVTHCPNGGDRDHQVRADGAVVACHQAAAKVWVVTAVEDDGTDAGYRYPSGVFATAEAAHEHAEHGSDVQEFDVQ